MVQRFHIDTFGGKWMPYDDHLVALAEQDKKFAIQIQELTERLVDDFKHQLAEKEQFLEQQRTATYQAVMREQATKKLLSEKERELARLKEWQQIVVGAGTDQEAVVRMAAAEYTKTAIECWKDRVAQLQAELDRVIGALEKIMTGGNHLALCITNSFGEHPMHDASLEDAATFYKVGVDGWDGQAWKYDVWICWKAIMAAVPLVQSYRARQGKEVE